MRTEVRLVLIKIKDIKPYIELPKKFIYREDSDPLEEAEFYAKLYKKAKTDKKKYEIVCSLLYNGSNWDTITRSCLYLPEFENIVGKKFPELWR